MTAPPTVVLVDDHALFRAGVRAELENDGPDGTARATVLGEAGDVDVAVRLILDREPDVVLLDVHMPGGGGAEVLRRVHETRPGQKVLALSVSDEPEDVIALIRGGARGYVTKTISGDELAAAIGKVRDGDAVFSPRLAGFVLDAFAGRIGDGEGEEPLSRIDGADPPDHGDAAAAGHVDVEEDDVGAGRRDHADGLLDRAGLADDIDQSLDLGANPAPEQRVVVDDDDRRAIAHRAPLAIASTTSVPDPGTETIVAVPPCRCMRPTIDSRTPRRSSGNRSGSKPGPRSRTNASICSGPTSA
jgi:DNA-binding NarL/FixJ family response regulator